MAGLFEVAEHLSSQARTRMGDEADAFGRSAFNRYYYASFLTVRDLLVAVDGSWGMQSHANIPNLLEVTLPKRISELATQQARSGILNPKRAQSLRHEATTAGSDIASILRLAYAVRVTADYEPAKRVSFDTNGFSLGDHSDAEARNWKARVERGKGVLLKISREVGLGG